MIIVDCSSYGFGSGVKPKPKQRITHISNGGSTTLCNRTRQPGDISITLTGMIGSQSEGKTLCKTCRRIYFR